MTVHSVVGAAVTQFDRSPLFEPLKPTFCTTCTFDKINHFSNLLLLVSSKKHCPIRCPRKCTNHACVLTNFANGTQGCR